MSIRNCVLIKVSSSHILESNTLSQDFLDSDECSPVALGSYSRCQIKLVGQDAWVRNKRDVFVAGLKESADGLNEIYDCSGILLLLVLLC